MYLGEKHIGLRVWKLGAKRTIYARVRPPLIASNLQRSFEAVYTSQMAAEIKTLFIRNHIYLHTDSEKDVQVLRERFLEWKYRNAYKLNGKY